jgi:hypothetical protein
MNHTRPPSHLPCPGFTQPTGCLLLGLSMTLGVSLSLPVLAQESITHLQTSNTALGTLFYRPAERTALVAARSSSETGLPPNAPPNQLQLDGLVRRPRGKSTVWFNGQPVAEGQSIALSHPYTLSRQEVQVASQSLRVGETLDLASGLRHDVVAPGSVTPRKR